MGYSTYLTFPLGYGSTLVTVYYLAMRNVPGLQEIFPKFLAFGVVATIAILPLSVFVGWIHMKRSSILVSEAQVTTEASPWNYMLPEGIATEVQYPFFRETLVAIAELLDREGLLDASRRKRFEGLVQKFDVLLKGGSVGKPRRKM